MEERLRLTKEKIISGLEKHQLHNLAGRPYDCTFDLLAAPRERKRLIMVGFNGSDVDKDMTNAQSVMKDFISPSYSNIHQGTLGGWGIKHLATRLQSVPEQLGFNWEETVYTNALMLCSRDAFSIKKAAEQSPIQSLDKLIVSSMRFFAETTFSLCQPELIIAYSNGMSSHSSGRLLLHAFGEGQKPQFVNSSAYYSTYSFKARFGEFEVPVVGIRHMSRFKPDVNLIQQAWDIQR
ncbi:MAG: hypothetical protein E6560_08025 [Yersiniaceae bacterium]|nr:hypothetical protein [Yersiniaceae bacterium]